MSERGFAATSIGAICTATGLTAPTIYWHFGSKDGLLAAVVARSVDAWYGDLESAMAEGDQPDGTRSLAAALDRFVEVMTASYRTSPAALRMMLWLGLDRSEPNHEVRRAVQQARLRAIGLLAEALERFLPTGSRAVFGDAFERLARLMLVHLDGVFVAHEIDDDADRLDELFALARIAVTAAGLELLRDVAEPGDPEQALDSEQGTS
jgi:AcrR family transcriptional regulator